MSLLSATLGRLAPQFRTLGEWACIYDQIIETRPLCTKTLQNRRASIRHIVGALGDRSLRSIRPLDVAVAVRDLHARAPVMARRVLVEARDMLGEAVSYGWIARNPALDVKQLRAPVRRRRLSLEQWQMMYQAACEQPIAWLPHMLLLALVTGQRRADLAKMGFEDIWDGRLHIEQQKTGARIALPLKLRLDLIDSTLSDVIEGCKSYAAPGQTFLRKPRGAPLGVASLSTRFEALREAVCEPIPPPHTPPTLHECRSLAERLYRAQGLDTRTLLGHRRQSMTDQYNDDRGLDGRKWRVLQI